LATLWLLDAVVPGGLPSWFGYAVSAVCFAFVYTRIIRAWLEKRRQRESSDGATS
jgi:hypothetical protein